MGFTQHTVGVQNIRAMSIIQMLLGNMGVAGGGVNALRGSPTFRAPPTTALLYHILPGYLAAPTASLAYAGRLQPARITQSSHPTP